jgi:hypothetical protein
MCICAGPRRTARSRHQAQAGAPSCSLVKRDPKAPPKKIPWEKRLRRRKKRPVAGSVAARAAREVCGLCFAFCRIGDGASWRLRSAVRSVLNDKRCNKNTYGVGDVVSRHAAP